MQHIEEDKPRTKRKLYIAIAGLSLLLIAVFPRGKVESKERKLPTKDPYPHLTASRTKDTRQSVSLEKRKITWPEISVDHVALNDPFQNLKTERVAEVPAVVSAIRNVLPGPVQDLLSSNTDAQDTSDSDEERPIQQEAADSADSESQRIAAIRKQKLLDEARATQQRDFLTAHKIQFVFQSNKETVAMIGSKVYHEGDTIDGFQLVKIGPDGIDFRRKEDTAEAD